MKKLSLPTFSTLLLLQLFLARTTIARPTNLQEQNVNYYKSFFKGTYVGFQTLLSLTGYYESKEVKESLSSGQLVIDEETEENQTFIKVVGLGLGRTGTTSLVIALEILGFTPVHDDEQTEITDLYQALEKEQISMDEFHEILGLRGYNATFKTASYEWVAEHPEVKAILTVRDSPDQYVNSWLQAASFVDIMECIPFRWMPTVHVLKESFDAEFKLEPTGYELEDEDDYLDPETLKEAYEEYIEEVTDAIPSERLLVFNVKQGWTPLCKFLDIDEKKCPKENFPHVHTRAKLEGEMFFLKMITYVWPLAFILPMMAVRMLVNKCSY